MLMDEWEHNGEVHSPADYEYRRNRVTGETQWYDDATRTWVPVSNNDKLAQGAFVGEAVATLNSRDDDPEVVSGEVVEETPPLASWNEYQEERTFYKVFRLRVSEQWLLSNSSNRALQLDYHLTAIKALLSDV